MIKTNEWTVADLIGYLVSIMSTLTPEEMSRLKATAAFSKEGATPSKNEKPQRFLARQLYEPNDVLRQLELPIIDWGTQKKWRSSSKEGADLETLVLSSIS